MHFERAGQNVQDKASLSCLMSAPHIPNKVVKNWKSEFLVFHDHKIMMCAVKINMMCCALPYLTSTHSFKIECEVRQKQKLTRKDYLYVSIFLQSNRLVAP